MTAEVEVVDEVVLSGVAGASVSVTNYGQVETAFGPIHVVDGLPDDVVLLVYSPPADGTYPGHPDWVPLERRAAVVVDRPDESADPSWIPEDPR